jgi:hypothetical protein
MNHVNNTAIIYLSAAVILPAALIYHLEWPVAAEIPLCISIFIQLTAIAKAVQNMLHSAGLESIPEALAVLKDGAMD